MLIVASVVLAVLASRADAVCWHQIVKGDTCYDLANTYGIVGGADQLAAMNPTIACTNLQIGSYILTRAVGDCCTECNIYQC